MKKIFLLVSVLVSSFFSSLVPAAFAAEGDSGSGSNDSYVYVTEKIPGAVCTPVNGRSETDVKKRLYKCSVGQGFDTVIGMLGSLIKYATYITGLVAVLMIVLSGIQYSMSGGGEDAKKAKGRIIQLVAGLILLFLVGFILNTVAPWVYK
ncbi:MAG: hypothetical protein QG650_806 [Patescibacteria group bacterium]|nr:hypothetical protein [Patescibacteria group bacterium]